MSKTTETYEGRYVAWGPPGTGKTTFLSNQVRKLVSDLEPRVELTSPVVVCSLTRAAAAEIGGREIPVPRWQIGTLHSLAYRMLDTPPVAEVHLKEWNEKSPSYAIKEDSKPDTDDMDVGSQVVGDAGVALYNEYNLLRAWMIEDRNMWPMDVRRFAQEWEEWKNSTGRIDFTDMIELATHETRHAPGDPRVILLDEAQDFSRAEWELIRHWSEATDAVIVTGDRDQTLYEWRGADSSIFLDPSIPEDHRKVLHQSYRVPRRVKDLAIAWMQGNAIDYHEPEYRARDADGEVQLSSMTSKSPSGLLRQIEEWLGRDETVMVCATCGYMLNTTVKLFRSEGLPFSNPWRRKRGDWNPLRASRGVPTAGRVLDFLRVEEKGTEGAWTQRQLADWVALVKADKALERGMKKVIETLAKEQPLRVLKASDLEGIFQENELASLKKCLEGEGNNIEKLLAWLEDRLLGSRKRVVDYVLSVIRQRGTEAVKKEPLLHIGTIHSFKGAEADHVIMFPDLSPAGMREWQNKKTRNNVARTIYVGITRARQSLTVCRPVSPMSVKLQGLAARFG